MMNPPSALAGAMSRDRKPFTYTPGGLDLSEIKSEKMAKRLMRNAMNQGIPERPQQLQSPPTPTTPIAVPNFNCLPVQVFPTFNVPANPKSLLRTRSVPSQQREPTLERGHPPQIVNNVTPIAAPQLNIFNKNNRPASMYEPSSNDSRPMNYGSSGHTAAFPETSYDVPEYMRVQPNATNTNTYTPIQPTFQSEYSFNNNYILPKVKDTVSTLEVVSPVTLLDNNDNKIIKEAENNVSTNETVTKPVHGEQTSTEQSEVKVTKKQVKQETSVKETNGTQNGDADTEAEMTVQLPTKKSAAKTETQVEVSKKTLPDGTVEEVKKTITKTTIDGKTEIRTKTETRLIPKDNGEDEEEEVLEEEEEEDDGEVQEIEEQETKEPETTVVIKNKENGQSSIIKTAERSETTTTSSKKVVIVQNDKEEEAEEEYEEEDVEEEVEAEPVTFVIKKAAEKPPTPKENEKDEEPEEEQPVEIVEVKETKVEEIVLNSSKDVQEEVEEDIEPEKEVKEEVKSENKEEEEEIEEEEQYEEVEETEKKEEVKVVKEDIKLEPEIEKEDKSVNDSKEENEEQNVDKAAEETNKAEESAEQNNSKIEMKEQQITEEKQEVIVESHEVKSEKPEAIKEVILTPKIETSDTKRIFREPSVPLEKVEDVEIKPIGAGDFTKTHTHSTEIIANPDLPSIVTKYNRTETIETVKRTVETLDPSQPISLFTPHVEKVLSPQIQRPYQPVYPPEPTVERRHSLLLDRLSMERQLPTDVYQNTSSYTSQTTEQQQWSQEPQAEILEVENVKPSTITNQQWFQQSKRDVSYSNSTPAAQSTPPIWVQQQSKPQQQPIYSPQPQYQQPSPQPQYQPNLSPQPQYQRQPSPQPQYQQPSPQPQYQQPSPQPQYQQPTPQPQYQPTYSTTTQETTSSTQYSSYPPSKPSTWTPGSNTYENSSQSNQYSSYQNKQQYSSSYVPPPWEQDNTYVSETSQNYYQPPSQTPFSPTPTTTQSWKPPPGKFTKPAPTAYIPPKPNQSFVKPVTNVEPPRLPGRKTYYSEYERRYISVPESTYIPGETKFQAQPDPSPQYYYDNNEPSEQVEHQWRKELREFTEKTQTQTQSSVNPPWESERSFPKTQETYTPTPTWSQTVRPQSWRERSFESEFVSQEWPKTNTLGRGRPLSSYGKETIPERTRGVSVDRYNPNNYQSPVPSEHPPVQTYTHNPPAPHATGYHNPNVPAYHARASAEPREQQTYQQPRAWRAPQPSPIQSRSFKYLQWITGTDD